MTTKFIFTKAMLDAIPRPESGKRSYYYDEKTPGLTVQQTITGAKTFQVYKWMGNKSVRVTLGKYPSMTIETARKLAALILAEIASGINPNQKKKADKMKGVTLQKCFDDYLQTKAKLKQGTVLDYKRVMNEGFNDWQDKPLKDINRDMVAAKHRKLGRNSEARANNSMRVLRALFNFAAEIYEDEEGRTLFPDNPVKRLSKTKSWFDVERKQTIIKEHELKPWFDAVLSLSLDDGSNYETARDYLLMLMLTGMRKTEAAKLLWDNVDFQHRTLKIVDTKNSKPHTLPLSQYLYDLLENRYAMRTQERFVFPSEVTKTGYVADLRRFVGIVRARSEVFFTLHDIRRSFITIAEGRDISVYALKRLVNHSTKSSDVTDGYIINDVERLRKPVELITDYILRVGGVKKSPDVVNLNDAEQLKGI
jgi:integrase